MLKNSNFNNFRLAYSISIHKAQGSEFDVVVIPIVKGYRKMLYQKLIYTAVTRAKKKLYITTSQKIKSFNRDVEQMPSIVFDELLV